MPPSAGASYHGTIGTVVNPALRGRCGQSIASTWHAFVSSVHRISFEVNGLALLSKTVVDEDLERAGIAVVLNTDGRVKLFLARWRTG